MNERRRTTVAVSSHAPSVSDLRALRDATLSTTYVSLGSRRTLSPHEFYRYPARFSPEFARAAITAFTDPGDVVLDPFVGGGTTLVEGMALGRRTIGSDINPLATFVAKVKTTPLDYVDVVVLRRWASQLHNATALEQPLPGLGDWEAGGYFKDLDEPATAAIRDAAAKALARGGALATQDARDFARCVVLRTAQWAFDMRSVVPTADEFRRALVAQAHAMIAVASDFADDVWEQPRPLVLTEALPGLAARSELLTAAPRLILTSPPYPGVYVIYHRWKLRGRREIPAPYWIIDRRDGHGQSTYTMSARTDPLRKAYFTRLGEAFSEVARIATADTAIVQIVGFGEPSQLDRYLGVMDASGLEEIRFPEVATDVDGRLWRSVPNRRWWTEATAMRAAAPTTAREVVLFHRVRQSTKSSSSTAS